jgi:hypothetical protein
MSVVLDHPLARTLDEAAHGDFPAADGVVASVGALPGPCDAVAFFADHVLVAAAVEQDWVDGHLAERPAVGSTDPSGGLGLFLAALSERLGRPPMYASLLTSAPHRSGYLHGRVEPGGEPEPGWAAYRTDVRCYRYRGLGASGAFAIGRGPGDRWDVHIRVDEGSGGRVGRELLSAAKTVIPERGMLFGSAPLHDARVLRTLLASGFQPICTEVLLLTRPGS